MPSIEALKDKGVAILPKLEAEMQVMTSVAKDKTGDERKEATMYFFVKDGVVVDTEPKINERDYDLPKFVYDGAGFTRWQGQQQAVDNKQQITHQLNNKNMENKLDDNRQKDKLDDNRQKELKDGFYPPLNLTVSTLYSPFGVLIQWYFSFTMELILITILLD